MKCVQKISYRQKCYWWDEMGCTFWQIVLGENKYVLKCWLPKSKKAYFLHLVLSILRQNRTFGRFSTTTATTRLHILCFCFLLSLNLIIALQLKFHNALKVNLTLILSLAFFLQKHTITLKIDAGRKHIFY